MRSIRASVLGLLCFALVCVAETASACYGLDSLLAPGNAVHIAVYPDTTHFLHGVYPIDDRGCIKLPIAGLVHVASSTRAELVGFLEKELEEFLRYPNIEVTPLIRVSLLGGFFSPGLYWVDPRATLWETVARAGGIQREDGIKKLRWERDRQIVVRDLVPLYQSDKSLLSIGFRSGDQLWVTSRPRATAWERFRTDLLPVITASVTVITSSITLYQTYRLLREE